MNGSVSGRYTSQTASQPLVAPPVSLHMRRRATLQKLLQPVKRHLSGLHTVSKLDAALSQLDELAINLRIRRNEGILFVGQAPVDILSEIFRHAVADGLDRNDACSCGTVMGGEAYPRTLLKLRAVCVRWRTMTNNLPYLWTRLSTAYSPRTIQMMIASSALLPLSLKVIQKRCESKESQPIRLWADEQYFKPASFRLQNLQLRLENYHLTSNYLTRILDLDLPALQSLTFDSQIGTKQRIGSLVSFARHFPCLRVLQLTHVTILSTNADGSACGSHELKSLKLRHAHMPGSLSKTLSSLAQCFPRLIALELRACGSRETDSANTHAHPLAISFPCLSSIALHELPSGLCVNVIGRLALPALCRIRISFHIDYFDPPAIANAGETEDALAYDNTHQYIQHTLDTAGFLLEFCYAHLLQRDASRHSSYTVELCTDDVTERPRFRLGDSSNGSVFPYWDRGCGPTWTFESQVIDITFFSTKHLPLAWSDIRWPSMSQLTSVQSLRLLSVWDQGAPDQARKTWDLLEQLFPNIRATAVDYDGMAHKTVAEEYLGALQAGRSPPFPSLEYLAVYYRSWGIEKPGQKQDMKDSEMLDFVHSCLAGRHKIGRPYRGIEIVWCHCALYGRPTDKFINKFLKRVARYKLDDISMIYLDNA